MHSSESDPSGKTGGMGNHKSLKRLERGAPYLLSTGGLGYRERHPGRFQAGVQYYDFHVIREKHLDVGSEALPE